MKDEAFELLLSQYLSTAEMYDEDIGCSNFSKDALLFSEEIRESYYKGKKLPDGIL